MARRMQPAVITYVWTSCEHSLTPAPYLHSRRAMQLPAASSRNTRSDSASVESRPTPSDWPERALGREDDRIAAVTTKRTHRRSTRRRDEHREQGLPRPEA